MRAAEPKVTVIIPNWNGMDHVFECLASLSKLEYSSFNVIVVDNHSEDGSPEMIAERFPDVQIIRNPGNLGFAGGCNVGISQALKADAAYVWLLNNDAIVEPASLRALVQVAENEQDIGMTGSKVYQYHDRKMLWGVGMMIDWIHGETHPIGWHQSDSAEFSRCRDVDGLAGSSLLVKRRICEEVGLMDEDYFLYAEEIEWCVRARQKGFRCVVVPQSVIFHKEGASSGDEFHPIFSYYNTRNMLRTISKSFPFPKKQYYLLTAIGYKLWMDKRTIVKAFIVRVFKSNAYKYDASALLGIIDFVFGKSGMKSRAAIMSFQNVREIEVRSAEDTVQTSSQL